MEEFIVEDYLETLISLRGNKLVGVGSSKLAFASRDMIITIPYTSDGILELDSQCINYLQVKDSEYSMYFNPVYEYEKYKMISPKLDTDISTHLVEDLLSTGLSDIIPVEEAFASFNVGKDSSGQLKSFDYGNYNDGESICSDLIEDFDNNYFIILRGRDDVAHIMAKSFISYWDRRTTFKKNGKLFIKDMLIQEDYTELNIYWGNLQVGDCELYLDGDNLKITSFYIAPRFRRLGLGGRAFQEIVAMEYTVTGDAVPDAYEFWKSQEVEFECEYEEHGTTSTYGFIM